MGFTKLDNGIITSSIWSEKYHTRILWITMLAMCNMDGFVSASKSGLKRSANITDEEFEESIKCLESPDPESRSSNDDGRRIYKVEGGWQVINHLKYRKKQYCNDRFDENYSKKGYVYFAKTKDNKIKIGYSVNPWARIRELKTAAPDAELILVIDGTYEDEKNYQNRFIHLHIAREWFKYEADLKEYITSKINSSETVATKVDTNYVSVSVSNSVSSSDKELIEEIYKLYPNNDINNVSKSTGKSSKNKDKIARILKTKYPLKKAIEFYLSECKRTKCYLKNFSTFLNNLPDESTFDLKNVEPAKEMTIEERAEEFMRRMKA